MAYEQTNVLCEFYGTTMDHQLEDKVRSERKDAHAVIIEAVLVCLAEQGCTDKDMVAAQMAKLNSLEIPHTKVHAAITAWSQSIIRQAPDKEKKKKDKKDKKKKKDKDAEEATE